MLFLRQLGDSKGYDQIRQNSKLQIRALYGLGLKNHEYSNKTYNLDPALTQSTQQQQNQQ